MDEKNKELKYKRCYKCGKEKFLFFFHADKNRKDGRNNLCNNCKASWSLLDRYGIDLNTYELLLAQQMGLCELCGTNQAGGKHKTFHVDHDHSTGNVRALLCNRCNLLLGSASDSIELFENIIEYLKKYKEN